MLNIENEEISNFKEKSIKEKLISTWSKNYINNSKE